MDPAVGGGPAPAPPVRLVRAERAVAPARDDARSAVVGGDPSPSSDELTTARQSARWDEFHEHHDAGDFFKERRYLLAEFPALAVDAPTTILEIGCGSGARASPSFAPTPARASSRATSAPPPSDAPPAPPRASTSPTDSPRSRATPRETTSPPPHPPPPPTRASPPTRPFARRVSSSSSPPCRPTPSPRSSTPCDERYPRWSCIFRDYGVYDLPMLRFVLGSARKSRVREGRRDPRSLFPRRGNRDAFANAGFEEVTDPDGAEPVRYCCVHNENRKKGIKMRRVFVHGVFRRSREPNDPDDSFRGERRRNVDAEKGYEDWRRGEARFVARIAADYAS